MEFSHFYHCVNIKQTHTLFIHTHRYSIWFDHATEWFFYFAPHIFFFRISIFSFSFYFCSWVFGHTISQDTIQLCILYIHFMHVFYMLVWIKGTRYMYLDLIVLVWMVVAVYVPSFLSVRKTQISRRYLKHTKYQKTVSICSCTNAKAK